MERTVSHGQSWSNAERGGGTSRKASPGQCYRQAFKEAVSQGGLDFPGYCRLAAQAMLQLAIEEEAAEFIPFAAQGMGRAAYQRLGGKRTTYRNGYKRRCFGPGITKRGRPRVGNSSSAIVVGFPMRWSAWPRVWRSA